jgi:hypothetical protein
MTIRLVDSIPEVLEVAFDGAPSAPRMPLTAGAL